jgi:hypothetical protein
MDIIKSVEDLQAVTHQSAMGWPPAGHRAWGSGPGYDTSHYPLIFCLVLELTQCISLEFQAHFFCQGVKEEDSLAPGGVDFRPFHGNAGKSSKSEGECHGQGNHVKK